MINLVSGSKTLLTVTGLDAIGRAMALTDPVSFSVDHPEVATVEADGWLAAVADGSTTVIVTCGSLTLSVPVTVTAPVAVGLVVAESIPVAS